MVNTIVTTGFGFQEQCSELLRPISTEDTVPAGWKSFREFSQRQNIYTCNQGQGKSWGLLAGVNQSAAQLVTSYSNIT